MDRAAASEASSLHAKLQVLKNFELTGRSVLATLHLMLSPGGKCCLISQSCKKAQVSPQYQNAYQSLKIQERCKARQHYIRFYCPVLCIREIYKYTDQLSFNRFVSNFSEINAHMSVAVLILKEIVNISRGSHCQNQLHFTFLRL